MDDLKIKLIECCKGKSTAEIAEVLSRSKHGGSIDDPLAVAALIKSWS